MNVLVFVAGNYENELGGNVTVVTPDIRHFTSSVSPYLIVYIRIPVSSVIFLFSVTKLFF